MRLKALKNLALFAIFSAILAAPQAEARAHRPQRDRVVTLTTGDSTTYVVSRHAKKKKKKKSKSAKHAKNSKHSKRHPASTKKSHKHKGAKKKKHKRH